MDRSPSDIYWWLLVFLTEPGPPTCPGWSPFCSVNVGFGGSPGGLRERGGGWLQRARLQAGDLRGRFCWGRSCMPGALWKCSPVNQLGALGKGRRRKDQVREDQGKLEKLQEWKSMVSLGIRPLVKITLRSM